MRLKKKVKRTLIVFIVFVICICLFVFTNRSKKTVCSFESNQSSYHIKTTYTIISKKDIVTKIKSESTITSNKKDKLNELKTNLDNQYKTYNDKYGGYKYKITLNKNKVISNVTVDYKKYDMKKFSIDNAAMKEYIDKDYNYTIDGAKRYYNSIGAKCN